MNKKIQNATPTSCNDIEFKSLQEAKVYKCLVEEGITPLYEQVTFTLWEGFIPKVPFYTKNKFKRKNKHIESMSKVLAKDQRPVDNITYTPDFTFRYNGKLIIIEVKGFENDVFPYKFKMFRKELEYMEEEIELWEIFNLKQLKECINHLKKSD